MNELICAALIAVVAMIFGATVFIAPRIINYVKSFIKWHRRTDLDDISEEES